MRLPDRFNITDYAYAHRGLWTSYGPTENSLEAFLLAANHGLGIEFDVRPASDGVPIVFHDPVLDRMTDKIGSTEQFSSEDLIGMTLKGGGEIISLSTLLHAWPAKTPLLCEMKVDGSTDPTLFAEVVAKCFSEHAGPAAMMSFSTQAVAAIPTSIMRGQLIAPAKGDISAELAAVPKTTVDYLACHVGDAANLSLQKARATLPLVTWTVKSQAECAELSNITDSQIFEGFDPDLAKRHILNT